MISGPATKLSSKKLGGWVDGSVSQPKTKKPIDAPFWTFDHAIIMTYILREVEDDPI